MCSSGYTVVKNNNYILPFQKGENYPCLDLSLFDWFADNQEGINTTHSKMMQQEIFFYKFYIINVKFYQFISLSVPTMIIVHYTVLVSFCHACALTHCEHSSF
jgi:hypothetical protein